MIRMELSVKLSHEQQFAIANSLRTLADHIDQYDNGDPFEDIVNDWLSVPGENRFEVWRWVAYLIADHFDIPTEQYRRLANGISRELQSELRY